MESDKNLLQCYNRGCGQLFDPKVNSDESCRHHPGAPYFHDAYKGWSCCNKKSVDFTEFLNIRGCTLSKHSNEKPQEPNKPQQEEKIVEIPDIVQLREPVKVALPRPSIELPLIPIQATVAPAHKESIDKLQVHKSVSSKRKSELSEIVIGTICKNSGCTYSYTGTAKDSCECEYHPGVPIFHEGLKYWSCCQKRTTDFVVFMEQKGCAFGQHKWIKENNDKKVVQCRYDWHQTPNNVIVAIYAKMYHYQQSVIEVNPIRLHVKLIFPEQDNAVFELDLELRGIIDTSRTNAHMFGSKVEITLPKAEPGSWPKLHFPNANLPKIVPKIKSDNSKESACYTSKHEESDDDFNLDDIETVNSGFRLAEIS